MGIVYSYFRGDFITRDELTDFFKENDWEAKYKTLLFDYQCLQKDYNEHQINRTRDIPKSNISMMALKDYINDEILSTDANSKYIPDPIERKAYLTIYKTVLESIQQLSNSTDLNFLNHKISFHIEPN